MPGERTEQATPRRRSEARDRGQVLKSVEVNTAVVLLAGAWMLQSNFESISVMLIDMTRYTFTHIYSNSIQYQHTVAHEYALGDSRAQHVCVGDVYADCLGGHAHLCIEQCG